MHTSKSFMECIQMELLSGNFWILYVDHMIHADLIQ